ncbi:enoyl-CoA hydratase-related protein [Nocardia sp. R6R-6]|uniref:enoyl-CoA hydratase-related protein n=1 Tax=Nocardia sp. R6R-6 TaxID=3459303 RepID=UPI00403D5ED4
MRSTYETLIVEDNDGVALVTVNRPAVRNAISQEVQADLRSALAQLHDDAEVRAVVFTGAGGRAFVAGADIQRLRDYTKQTALQSRMQRLFDDIEAFEKPTIAAVNGFALGGGCELAMACDIRIAAQSARFGLPETGLAILPGAGGTQRLTRLVGLGQAFDMILTGRIVSASEALSMGLVSRVVGDDDLLAVAHEVATTISAKGPLAVRLAKLVMRTGADVDQRSGLVVERLAQALLYESEDKREGVEAFLSKRSPTFTEK